MRWILTTLLHAYLAFNLPTMQYWAVGDVVFQKLPVPCTQLPVPSC